LQLFFQHLPGFFLNDNFHGNNLYK